MVTVPEKIFEVISEYTSIISNEITIEKIFLFGSYANGTYHEDSDIDLAIFSKDFSDETQMEDMLFLLKKSWGLGFDIEPQPFTLEDYEDPVGIVEEILNTGMELKVV